jgi:tetratricopeptide (TPR) repeat protein
MKSLVFAFALLGFSYSASAQKGELSTAKINYEKYVTLKDAGSAVLAAPSLTIAKSAIDKASANEKTAVDASTWFYKVLIYANLAISETDLVLSESLIQTAKEAFNKAVKLDTEKKNTDLFASTNDILAQFQLNKGVKAFQIQDFKQAYEAFDLSLTYRPADTILTYYAGLAAINAQDYPAAIKKYSDLVKTSYSANKEIALDLSRLYVMQKDTANAILIASTYASKFNDSKLATQEIELSLMSGKQKEVISRINDQILKDPTNKMQYFYLGIAYDALKDVKNAESSYKKALEIDPKYQDAALNLGTNYLNAGIDFYNKANLLPGSKQKEYDLGMKNANIEFDRAFPYLKLSFDLNPKSESVLQNLKTYYMLKKNQAKVDEMTSLLKQLN